MLRQLVISIHSELIIPCFRFSRHDYDYDYDYNYNYNYDYDYVLQWYVKIVS
jgi:hypothetical protein